MVTNTHQGLAFVLALIAWLSLSLAQECTFNLRKSIYSSQWHESFVPCTSFFHHFLLEVYHTQKNLTVCNDCEMAASAPEESFTDCQQRLNETLQDMEFFSKYETMDKELFEIEQEFQHHAALKTAMPMIQEQLKNNYRKVLLLSIGAGENKNALMYYKQEKPTEQLHKDIVEFVYRDATQENMQLEGLLDFIRILPVVNQKLSLYQLLRPEILKRPTQRDSYLLMIAALDVGKVSLYEPSSTVAESLYLELFEPALKHLKDSVVKGSYDEIVKFAADYPDDFEEIENRLSTIDSNLWDKLNFNHFVTYPNSLPLAKQRLEAFRMIVQQVNDRNKNNYGERLPKVAREIEQCEQFIQNAKHDSSDLDKLASVKRLFTERDPKRGYEHYLSESKND